MTKSFKKKQHTINKLVRSVNKHLEQDEAFLGRIYLRQYSSGWCEYPDGSGGMWYGVIRIYDKETNMYRSVLGDYYEVQRKLWQEINDFVIMDLHINTGEAIAAHVDYRGVKHNPRDAKPFYPYYDKNYSYKRYE